MGILQISRFLVLLLMSQVAESLNSLSGLGEAKNDFGRFGNKNLDLNDLDRSSFSGIDGIEDLRNGILEQRSYRDHLQDYDFPTNHIDGKDDFAIQNNNNKIINEEIGPAEDSSERDNILSSYSYFDNNNAARDEEHLPKNPLWGHQYIQGGAGEGKQHLNPEGKYENDQVIKTDAFLPTYCDPPNPCPIGYTEEDGCLEGVKNTADYSREYQSQQDCICDREHMFDCPAEPNQYALSNEILASLTGPSPYVGMSNIFKGIQPSHIAKKGKPSYHRAFAFSRNPNPNFEGEKLHTVAKKGRIAY